MSVTTSQRLNTDQLLELLPDGSTLTAVGGELESNAEKVITVPGVTDQALQAAITTAASAFVDRKANTASLLARSITALTNNAQFLALPDPTAANNTYLAIQSPSAAQVAAQVRALTQQSNAYAAQMIALTRQIDALIRLATGQVDSTAGTAP